MSDIELDVDDLLHQAGSTAEHYLTRAYDILDKSYDNWTVGDAIELAKVMAQDFHSSLMGLKMQEIRDAITSISTSIDNLEL